MKHLSSRGANVPLSMIFVFFDVIGRLDAIQKRAAYFGCIAALDGSSEVLAPAGRPFSAWPASSVPPRSSRGRSVVAARRRRFAGSTRGGGRAHHRSRRARTEDGNRGRQTGVRLPTEVSGSGSSMSARPAPGVLTGRWVHSGRAGNRLRLTTAPGTSKHLAALDEVVDGTFNLWNPTVSTCLSICAIFRRRPPICNCILESGRRGSPVRKRI